MGSAAAFLHRQRELLRGRRKALSHELLARIQVCTRMPPRARVRRQLLRRRRWGGGRQVLLERTAAFNSSTSVAMTSLVAGGGGGIM